MNETDQEQQINASYVLIKFVGEGSVMFTMQIENVAPLQLLALASYLEMQANLR